MPGTGEGMITPELARAKFLSHKFCWVSNDECDLCSLTLVPVKALEKLFIHTCCKIKEIGPPEQGEKLPDWHSSRH